MADENQITEKEREDRRDEPVLPSDPIAPAEVQVGSKLRDAAVDPRAGDFLPPTNAGEAHPHSRAVVSPGIHASETGPIAPGPVSKDAREQEAKETELATAVFVENQPVGEATEAAAEKAGQPAPEDVPDTRPAKVEGEPEGASARASDGTSDTTDATRAVPKKTAAKAPAKPAEQ